MAHPPTENVSLESSGTVRGLQPPEPASELWPSAGACAARGRVGVTGVTVSVQLCRTGHGRVSSALHKRRAVTCRRLCTGSGRTWCPEQYQTLTGRSRLTEAASVQSRAPRPHGSRKAGGLGPQPGTSAAGGSARCVGRDLGPATACTARREGRGTMSKLARGPGSGGGHREAVVVVLSLRKGQRQ